MREIIVDSFAGGGGASLGIEMALGRSPDVAINHNTDALAMHAVNHPQTRHLNSNIWKINPDEVEPERPIGLMWTSPDCKHHSKAKGGKPLSRNIRDLAWVVVLWAQRRRPRVICLENVEEFRDWGPLGEDDRPIAARRGETFKKWTGKLKALGYRVEHRELRACDYGAPTIRKRLFLIARRDGRPIVWPAPTHGDPKSEAVRKGAIKPWRTAAEIIDWSLPCHSIFLTREEGRAVGVNRPLAENTMARIAKGVQRYVIDAAEPFIVPVTHAGDTRVHAVGEPLRTVTTAPRGEHAVVSPIIAGLAHGESGGRRSYTLEEPLTTVQPGGNNHALIAPTLVNVANGGTTGRGPNTWGPETPLRTITASPSFGLVAAHLTKFNTGSVGSDLGAPAPTVTANSFVKRPGGAPPIGVVSAFLAQHNYMEPGHDAREPVSTIVQKGCTQAIVEAALVSRQFGGSVGSSVDAPIGTVTAGGGGKSAVVSAGLVSLKGSDRRSSDIDAPHPTVTAQGTHSAEVRAFLMKYYGEGGQAQTPSDPLHTVPTKARFGLVTVKGEPYEIVDIGMRMLKARELFRAQGFPDDYIIDRRPDGSPLTATIQISCCGNSVSPVVARAIVAANYIPDEDEAPQGFDAPPPLFREAAE